MLPHAVDDLTHEAPQGFVCVKGPWQEWGFDIFHDTRKATGLAFSQTFDPWKEFTAFTEESFDIEGRLYVAISDHSGRLLDADEVGRQAGVQQECDGLYTKCPDKIIAVRAADCVPLILMGPKGEHIAYHVGCKGLKRGDISENIPKVLEKLGLPPCEVGVYVGPHIHRDHYPVSEAETKGIPEVFHRLSQGNSETRDLNLTAQVHQQLRACDISPHQIVVSDEDTFSSPHLHSYRGDQKNDGIHRSHFFMVRFNGPSDS